MDVHLFVISYEKLISFCPDLPVLVWSFIACLVEFSNTQRLGQGFNGH